MNEKGRFWIGYVGLVVSCAGLAFVNPTLIIALLLVALPLAAWYWGDR